MNVFQLSHLIAFVALLAAPLAPAASIPEPGTVFYGQVVNQRDGRHQILPNGKLTWTIGDGAADTTLTAQIESFEDKYFYRLEIPHSLLANGLTLPSGSIPIGAAPAEYQHVSIAVDGVAAGIRAPGQHSFTVEQLERAATHRLDLEISQPFQDSDGDGMPDWWEEKYGLNPFVNDAAGDLDGDGIGNLAEYEAGTNPALHKNQPDLVTTEALVFADGTSALFIKTADADSMPAQLIYTVVQAPAGLKRRNASPHTANPDASLSAGSTFTQAEINAGRIIFVHGQGGAVDPLRLSLRVSDGVTTVVGDVSIRFHRPDLTGNPATLAALADTGADIPGLAPAEQIRARIYLLARERSVIAWDLTPTAADASVAVADPPAPADPFGLQTLPARFAILGGARGDHFTGGSADDLLVGGPGSDTLTGGAGADRFSASLGGGNDTIADFNPAQGDMIDLSAVCAGTSTDLRDYVRLSGSTLAIDFDGNGSGFTDMTLTLTGFSAGPDDLLALFAAGQIVAHGKTMPSGVTLSVTQASASENGPKPAIFTITRQGPLAAPLSVGIALSGSATNGQDYEPLSTSVVIPAGQSSTLVTITPYPDSIVEPAEVVQITLQPGAGYTLGSAITGQATIADLQPEITLEALEPIAIADTGSEGVILLTRSGIVDRSVLVRLQIGGTATPVSDYNRLPTFVNLAANQTTALLTVTPAANPVIANGAESIHVTALPNASYLLGATPTATVTLVPTEHTFAAWQEQNFPAGQSAAMASSAPPASGEKLLRYAFQLTATGPLAGPGNLPAINLVGGHLAIEFTKDHAARDIRYIVEVSDDLSAWSTGRGVVEEVTPLDQTDARRSRWRSVRPMTGQARQYMRVRVEHSETSAQ